jgi:hypothetical protein
LMHLGEHQANRPSTRCERRPAAVVVSRHASRDVVSFADVKGVVGATKDVDEPHQTTMSSSECQVQWSNREMLEALRLAPFGRSLRAFSLSVACHGRSLRFAGGKRKLSGLP